MRLLESVAVTNVREKKGNKVLTSMFAAFSPTPENIVFDFAQALHLPTWSAGDSS